MIFLKFLRIRLKIILNLMNSLFYMFKSINSFQKFFFIIKNFLILINSEKLILEGRTFSKNEKIYYEGKYTFKYDDWFSKNISIWKFFLPKIFSKDKKINYLEIGSFEGRSCLFICENFKEANIVAVDTFKGKGKHNIDFKCVLDNFLNNTNEYKDRLNLNITDSKNFFENNTEKFDLIYIDGSHDMEDVKADCENALKFLNDKSILILDDFLWNGYDDVKKNPISAIIPFIIKNQKNIEILYMNYQVILKINKI